VVKWGYLTRFSDYRIIRRLQVHDPTLVEAIDRVLTEHRVEGLLSVTWEKQVEQTTQYVGRGRGSSSGSVAKSLFREFRRL
jgi:hypothetical protein